MKLKKIEPKLVDEPITIQSAFDELSTSAFSCWIRLSVASEKERTGYKNVQKLIGFSSAQTVRILQELRHKAYIETVRIEKRIRYEVRKKILLSGKSSFIRLSNCLTDNHSCLIDKEYKLNNSSKNKIIKKERILTNKFSVTRFRAIKNNLERLNKRTFLKNKNPDSLMSVMLDDKSETNLKASKIKNKNGETKTKKINTENKAKPFKAKQKVLTEEQIEELRNEEKKYCKFT